MSTSVGRPREYRNNAEKQKAHRERQKARLLQSEALRNSEMENRIREKFNKIGAFGTFKLPELFPELEMRPMVKGYSYCPCRKLKYQGWGLNGQVCSHCKNTVYGAVDYLERQRQNK